MSASRPLPQRHLTDSFYLPLLTKAIGSSGPFQPQLVPIRLAVLVILLLNLPFVPIVAIFPPLHDAILTRLNRMGRVTILGVDWTNLYLLQTPAAKLLLACSSQLALAVLLTLLPGADAATSASDDSYAAFVLNRFRGHRGGGEAAVADADAIALQQYVPWLLILAGAALYHDISEAYRSRALYVSDSLNSLEAPSLLLVTSSLFLLWLQGGHTELTRGLLGFGLISMYLAQGLRVFSLSPSLGPLVLMFFRMIQDVLRWLLLLSVVLVGFSAAFHTVFKGSDSNCVFGDGVRGDATFGKDVLSLFELVLGVSPDTACLRGTEHWIVAPLMLYLFLLLAVVLLLNMLIAMMAKSFDNIYEAQALSWQLMFAQLVLTWEAQPGEPPPFTLLRLPFELFFFVRNRCAFWRGAQLLRTGYTKYLASDIAPQDSRGWNAKFPNPAALSLAVSRHVTLHQGDVVPEERWRSDLMKKLYEMQHGQQQLMRKMEVQSGRDTSRIFKASDVAVEESVCTGYNPSLATSPYPRSRSPPFGALPQPHTRSMSLDSEAPACPPPRGANGNLQPSASYDSRRPAPIETVRATMPTTDHDGAGSYARCGVLDA